MFAKHDLTIAASAIILSLIGLFTLLSTTLNLAGDFELTEIVTRQLTFILVGLISYLVISRSNYQYWRYPIVILAIYLLTIGLLITTLAFGPVINNVKRWIFIGGVQIQAAEIAKITVIMLTAAVLTYKERFNEWLLAGVTLLLVIPIVALVYLQPHGSMSAMLLFLWAATLFTFLSNQMRNILLASISGLTLIGVIAIFVANSILTGVVAVTAAIVIFIYGFYSRESLRKFFLGALVLGVMLGFLGAVGWNDLLKDYQKDRIEAFLNPEGVDEDQLFNVRQSQVAIGSGGIFGKGFGAGTQSRLQYIPEHQTDFIFATYAEQFGLVGSLFLIAVYIFLIAKIIWRGMSTTEDLFASALLVGIGWKLLIEVFVNIGTNTGVIPATGVPLPLISSGGSITIMTLVSLGIVQSIAQHHHKEPEVGSLVDNDELLI